MRYLWQQMAQRQEKFYVKASFLEIYNEQLNDLLEPSSENLHYRWNVQNGFFVEDLTLVECSNVDDMIAVLNQGMKHRKIGSHELNKDSSRSHSILTIYLVIELNSNGQVLRKIGKLSFVDLAGSERLKESKSQGAMIKETQQINKSLASEEVRARLAAEGAEATPATPQAFAQLISSDIKRWAKVVKEANIKAD